MRKNELMKEILALPPAEQREIFDLLRGQVGLGESGASMDGAPEKKRVDPWGTVYREMAKTFRGTTAR